MDNKLLFENFRQWRVCFCAGVSKMVWGICRIITAIVLGIVSILVWLWRKLIDFVGLNPKFSIITAVIAIVLVWLFTFVNMRSRAVGAEHQRDSLSYELSKFTQAYSEYDSLNNRIIYGGGYEK